jgi:B12-binding domain/radical SAM domain protein
MPQPDVVLVHPPSVYDFRQKTILYGPVSDLVPSTTVFEMYPVGLTTIAEYLERHGYQTRILNLAVRMLREPRFDPEKALAKLNPKAFGIDLHWLPHAQGALEVAKIIKKYHPDTPVIFGGFSATYFEQELCGYPQVDFVVKGDSTEEPVLELINRIVRGREIDDVPNLTWKDGSGQVRSNPITHSPQNLDHVLMDYSYVVQSVVRDRDMASYIPFRNWLDYPITAAIMVRGCMHNCVTCGGSSYTFRRIFNRDCPAYRSPHDLAQDIKGISNFSRGPIIIIGDIRQPGMEYAHQLLDELRGSRNPFILEFFQPASREFVQEIAASIPNFVLEMSLESHDPQVRRAFGKTYTNEDIEATMSYALDAGCRRLDVFFMTGLPQQTPASVEATVDYCEHLLKQFPDGRLFPFISPLAPFLDPGSMAFDEPEKHGYRLRSRTLEEHRQALLQPTWKHIINYETNWMTADEIASSTYKAGIRLNRLKAQYGLIDHDQADITEARIYKAMELMEEIDHILATEDAEERAKHLQELKAQVDEVNLSTVCEKSELDLPVKGLLRIRVPQVAWFFARRWWNWLLRREAPSLSG